MSLQYYIDAFSTLRMNKSGGSVSPHKACLLLSVMDLVEQEAIVTNRIYLDENLKSVFTKHFELLRQGNDQNTLYLPFYHLKTSGFWHHKIYEGRNDEYNSLKESNSENKTLATIEYAFVDNELFEYFKSYNAREALKAALADNFDIELRDKLLNPAIGWSWWECEAIVKDYFAMLEAELKGEAYNKSEHNRRLQEILNNRNKSSIEKKHQNISAILKEMGMPTIDGYKPLSNYQRNILPDVIGAELSNQINMADYIESITTQDEAIPTVDDILNRLVDPPEPKTINDIQPEPYKRGSYRPRKVDYIAREANNHKLGLSGEKFIVNYEKARLIKEGRESLAERIDHVSLDDDRLGFDIHSFEGNGKDRFIEVKTTRYARYTQFYITNNELEVSRKLDNQYHLYRVFNFRTDPRFFTCQGKIEKNFVLEPSLFIANILSA